MFGKAVKFMVYVLLVDGFEEVEAIEPIDILRRGSVEVKTIGVYDKYVTGAHGIKVEADIAIEEAGTDIELLIVPGGPGHTLIEKSEKAMKMIKSVYEKNITVAAICAAPSILGKIGILEGKRATCFPGYEKFLLGAEISKAKVENDGNIITAKGAGAASDFGFEILKQLKGEKIAGEIKAGMQF